MIHTSSLYNKGLRLYPILGVYENIPNTPEPDNAELHFYQMKDFMLEVVNTPFNEVHYADANPVEDDKLCVH